MAFNRFWIGSQLCLKLDKVFGWKHNRRKNQSLKPNFKTEKSNDQKSVQLRIAWSHHMYSWKVHDLPQRCN